MKFAQSWWLLGTAFSLVIAALLILGAYRKVRAVKRFGDPDRVNALVTGRAGPRRAVKGILLVLAVAVAFVALARPQYGRGTRLIPATNLDVVIALDYSKSMYARDVTPFRITRAQSEVTELIKELAGARFGAVAFAGQPMSFPLTSDGAAISQFFRGLTPNDMPVGGTAIARALASALHLFERDPLSEKHRRVVVLVTDGEDLEGSPVSVAEEAAQKNVVIHVVQIGGRTPEPLPEVSAAGEVTGIRTDRSGAPITTSLSAQGEATLAKIAETAGGSVTRSAHGSTGIQEVTARLRRMMSEELSERVETVYADVYVYPLALSILLLLIEAFVSETRKRAQPTRLPPGPRRRPRRRKSRAQPETAPEPARSRKAVLTATLLTVLAVLSGCSEGGRGLFTRHSPDVDEAIHALDAGDATAATSLLEEYLTTGKCEAGVIGTPDTIRAKNNAGFDLGLALFKIGETFGKPFGEDEPPPAPGALSPGSPAQGSPAQGQQLSPEQQAALAKRSEQVECALRIVRVIGSDKSVALDLRARAHYLAGNLEFLRHEYASAVTSYDLSLALIPGLPDGGGDSIGRDAAWNRAIALRRKQEQERQDAGADASPDVSPDAGADSGQPDAGDSGTDGGNDAGSDGGDDTPDAGSDAGNDGGANSDSNQDGGPPDAGADSERDKQSQNQPQPPPEPPAHRPNVNQDERMLDMLEQAPTFQEQNAKNQALRRRGGGMEDK